VSMSEFITIPLPAAMTVVAGTEFEKGQRVYHKGTGSQAQGTVQRVKRLRHGQADVTVEWDNGTTTTHSQWALGHPQTEMFGPGNEPAILLHHPRTAAIRKQLREALDTFTPGTRVMDVVDGGGHRQGVVQKADVRSSNAAAIAVAVKWDRGNTTTIPSTYLRVVEEQQRNIFSAERKENREIREKFPIGARVRVINKYNRRAGREGTVSGYQEELRGYQSWIEPLKVVVEVDAPEMEELGLTDVLHFPMELEVVQPQQALFATAMPKDIKAKMEMFAKGTIVIPNYPRRGASAGTVLHTEWSPGATTIYVTVEWKDGSHTTQPDFEFTPLDTQRSMFGALKNKERELREIFPVGTRVKYKDDLNLDREGEVVGIEDYFNERSQVIYLDVLWNDGKQERLTSGWIEPVVQQKAMFASSGVVKTAITLPELVRETNAFSKKYRPGCSPRLLDSNPKALFLHYNVKCNKEDSDPAGHDVRVQFDVTKVQETQQAKDLDIQVQCSCPAFLYWGAQWNLHQRDGLLGPARPKLQAPSERLDLRGNFVICKHIHSVFERILPSVQHNIVKILREREVQRKKDELDKTPERLQEKQEEMKKKKELEKIRKTKDEKIKEKLLDSLKQEEEARLMHEQELEDQTTEPELEEVERDQPATEPIVEEPEAPAAPKSKAKLPVPEEQEFADIEDLTNQEEAKIEQLHKENKPHLHKGLPYDTDEEEGWQGQRLSSKPKFQVGDRVQTVYGDLMGTVAQYIRKSNTYLVDWDASKHNYRRWRAEAPECNLRSPQQPLFEVENARND